MVESTPGNNGRKRKHDFRDDWVYRTASGVAVMADSLDVLKSLPDGSVNAIITSPPFALQRQKAYGNVEEHDYIDWFLEFAKEFKRVLTDDGSLVIEIGGAWLPGQPLRSIYQFELLVRLVNDLGFGLAEDFYWHNPAKLPGPAEWVTIQRIRVKDSVSNIWWLCKTPRPKASNRRVLREYSDSQKKLFKHGYNKGLRPSGHVIGDKFGNDNGGAISPNLIEAVPEDSDESWPTNLIKVSNTRSYDDYQHFCKANDLVVHPARFPSEIPEFFVRMLTEPNDLVLDPFAGSNLTGAIAQRLDRRWMAIDLDDEYLIGSLGRFLEVDGLEVNVRA